MGVWLRRGLWQAEQDNSIALDRAKVFSQVIVPTEAFDELNDHRWQGDRLHPGRPDRPAAWPRRRPAREPAPRRSRFATACPSTGSSSPSSAAGWPRTAARRFRRSAASWSAVPTCCTWCWSGRRRSLQPGWLGLVALPRRPDAPRRRSRRGRRPLHQRGRLQLVPRDPLRRAAGNPDPADRAWLDDQTARARAARERDLVGLVEPHELVDAGPRRHAVPGRRARLRPAAGASRRSRCRSRATGAPRRS